MYCDLNKVSINIMTVDLQIVQTIPYLSRGMARYLKGKSQ